MADVITLVNTW